MAEPDRSTDASLSEALGEALARRVLHESREFDFFQLVLLLARAREGAVAPGGEGPAGRETIRFRPAASLGFAATDVEEVSVREIPGAEIPTRYVVTVNFMGLYGPASPMPNHVTEDLIWSGVDGETTRDFLDLFHHRMISFVYRAWEKYRYPYQFERDGSDPFSRRAFCLLGLGTPGMAENVGVPIVPLLQMAGALAERHRSAAGLRGFLAADFDGITVEVEACVERSARIPLERLSRLGGDDARLGETACLGERIRDRAGAFRVTLGPLSDGAFRRFLPGSPELSRLVRLTRLYAIDPLEFDVVLRLESQDVPPLRLSPEAKLHLGWMSWLSPRGASEGVVRVDVRDLDPLHAEDDRPHAAGSPRPRAEAPRPAPGGRVPAETITTRRL